jgi:hypothetical protein
MGDKRTEATLAPQRAAETVLHRRLEIHVEREWVSSANEASPSTDICPVCGCANFLALGEAVDLLGEGIEGLRTAIESGALHLMQTSQGEIAVCAQSVQQKK